MGNSFGSRNLKIYIYMCQMLPEIKSILNEIEKESLKKKVIKPKNKSLKSRNKAKLSKENDAKDN